MNTDADHLRDLLTRFRNRRIVVVGDFVADVFVRGEISRVSREAPVLILSHQSTETVPGGAANTVANLAALGAVPLPVGVIGPDESGQALMRYFRRLGIPTSGIRTLRGYATPTKTRILAGAAHASPQQVLRIDRGGGFTGDTHVRSVRTWVGKLAAKADAVLISDYGYGTVDPGICPDLAHLKIPVTLDSRHRLLQYSGVTAATPNEPEVEAALGVAIDDDPSRLEAAGRRILRSRKLRALLVTRGRHGMSLFEPRRKTVHIPIVGTDEVADVTGAGDTVIATFTLALASGATFHDAARLANHAGGIAVMKHGTRPVGHDELAGSVAGIAGKPR